MITTADIGPASAGRAAACLWLAAEAAREGRMFEARLHMGYALREQNLAGYMEGVAALAAKL